MYITTSEPTPAPQPGDPGFWEWVQANRPHNFPPKTEE